MSGSATEGLLLTVQEAAAELGLTPAQVRALVRAKRLAYVPIGRCLMIPREHLPHFVADNTVSPCPDAILAPTCASSQNAAATTSAGRSSIAAGSAARARQIAQKLRSPSPSSSTCEPEGLGRVIRLRPS
jgi:excisionase family DNA binding protein